MPHDFAGRQIKEGDHFIYASCAGRVPALKCGRVSGVSRDYVSAIMAGRFGELQNHGKPVRLRHFDRLVVMPTNQLPEAAEVTFASI